MKSTLVEEKVAQLYKTAHTFYLGNKHVDAKKIYIELLALDANHASALADLGTLYIQTKSLVEAELHLKKSLEINPNQAFVLNNLGTIYSYANNTVEANAYYERAIALAPNYADALNNLGSSYYGLRQYHNAIPHFRRVVAINPNNFDAQYHLALCLVATQQFDNAETHFNAALRLTAALRLAHELKAKLALLKFNLGLMKLLLGDFEAGLPLYEWRWLCDDTKKTPIKFSQPLWLGAENIAGKTILLHPEQGYGDYIQFCRYAYNLQKLGAKVILQVPKPLLPLIQTLSNKFTYIVEGETLPGFDLHCPIASLPLVFKTRLETIPAVSRYLKVPKNKKQYWQNKLGKKTLPRIGIAWSGSKNHQNDWKRSLPVHLLINLLRFNAEFHIIQKDINVKDKNILKINNVFQKVIIHQDDLHDFSDTAALIDAMDLIISVDTSVAHVAAALGKPVWLLISYLPDFRWLLNRDDSPWYPTIKLYRQTVINDWKEIVLQLNNELTQWLIKPKVLTKPKVNPVNHKSAKVISQPAIKALVSEKGDKVQLQKAIDLHLAGEAEKAEALYKSYLIKYPNDIGASNMLGTLLLQAGRLAEAETLIQHLLLIAPKNSFALCSLAIIYSDTNRKLEAITLCEQAVAINPNFTEAHNNLGTNLAHLEQNERAVKPLKRAIELKPDFTDAHFNLGLVYYRLKQFDLAENEFNIVIQQQPEHAGVYYNLSLLKLLQGEFETGLPLYESRWKDKQANLQIKNFKEPIWLGVENIQGKTILLHAEQGQGDFIQFCRYALEVEKLGASVILEVPAILFELAKTLSTNFTCVIKDTPLPAFDLHCPLLSLPLAFKTRLDSVPAKVPYFKVPENKKLLWQNKLGDNKLRDNKPIKSRLPQIGIVWSGTTLHLNDHNRSISLSQLGSLFNLNAEFHVLQKEVRASDEGALKLLQTFNHVKVHQYDLHDFVDTAALISEMDLVISVDTSVAHLAGALAAPVWVLLSYIPDFRWLLEREDSPWYPTARLFRQGKQGDWAEVIERVIQALEAEFI